MKIVIEIDEETYNDIKRGKIYSSYRDVPQESVVAIANGTPLQKEHGDAVSRDAVLKQINCWIGSGEYRYTNATHYLAKRMQGLSSITPQQKAGRWKRISMDKYSEHAKYWYRCDRCGKDNLGSTDYCPNCGAKMQEVEDDQRRYR